MMAIATAQLYILLLIISSVILFILWMLAIQQLCITTIIDKQRLIRTILGIIWATLGISLNLLVYISSIDPNFHLSTISMISNIIEACLLIMGFNIAHIVINNMIYNMYIP
eukprot:34549_1